MLTGYISSLHRTLDTDSSNLQPNRLAEALNYKVLIGIYHFSFSPFGKYN